MLRTSGLIALVVGLGIPLVLPKEAAPSDWPVERFVRTLEARLATEPEDAGAHYTLGRVHAFAFALERETLLGGGNEHFTWLKELEDQRKHVPAETAPLPTPVERLAHLTEGVRHLRRACTLDDSPLHRLTLAWTLETGATHAALVDTTTLFELTPVPLEERESLERWLTALAAGSAPELEEARRRLDDPEWLSRATALFGDGKPGPDPRRHEAVVLVVRRFWLERSIAEYRRCLDLVEEQGLFEDPMRNGPLGRQVPSEALEAYCRLVRARGVRGPQEEQQLAEADARWKELDGKPQRTWITPLVLTLDGCPTLDDVVAPHLTVPFDLDGDGVDELWPWIAPGAGWLVWDPERRGEITSGRQLFGSASAWLFFQDGYRVLDALDDDRDGELRGPELSGIAVWFDRDIDGVSDRGEVVPLEELGIAALATEATLDLGHSPANLCGLELADGRVLPTFDWVLESRREP